MEMDFTSVFWIDDFLIHLSCGDIKNIYINPVNSNIIGVYAPNDTSERMIKNFLISKVKGKKIKRFEYSFQPFFRYKDKSLVYIWGKPYLLNMIESKSNYISISDVEQTIYVEKANKNWITLFENIYYKEMYKEAIPRVNSWCKKMNLNQVTVDIKKLKRYRGLCYDFENKIELDLYLAKLPTICLEKIIVHELCHFFVHSHGLKFYRTIDKFFPDWRCGMYSYEYLEKNDPYNKWPEAEYIIVIGPY